MCEIGIGEPSFPLALQNNISMRTLKLLFEAEKYLFFSRVTLLEESQIEVGFTKFKNVVDSMHGDSLAFKLLAVSDQRCPVSCQRDYFFRSQEHKIGFRKLITSQKEDVFGRKPMDYNKLWSFTKKEWEEIEQFSDDEDS